LILGSSCLSLLSAEIVDVYHHAWPMNHLLQVGKWIPRGLNPLTLNPRLRVQGVCLH
jgi:hypothetical protein